MVTMAILLVLIATFFQLIYFFHDLLMYLNLVVPKTKLTYSSWSYRAGLGHVFQRWEGGSQGWPIGRDRVVSAAYFPNAASTGSTNAPPTTLIKFIKPPSY